MAKNLKVGVIGSGSTYSPELIDRFIKRREEISVSEIGVKVVNIQQPRALGIEAIGQTFRGQVCLETLYDIRSTLPAASEAGIRHAARRRIAHRATDPFAAHSGQGDHPAMLDTSQRSNLGER